MAEVNDTLGDLCLLRVWPNISINGVENDFCHTAWDTLYCWPPTQSGTTVKRLCSEVFQPSYSQYASNLQGHVTRKCLKNGTWAHNGESNYDECAQSFHSYVDAIEEDNFLIPLVHNMVFFGSILSLLSLAISLIIFYSFRCLKCDRITIRAQMMFSLVLRFVIMIIISEPFVFEHANSYRDVEALCKIILVLFVYSMFSSISWMFVQGIFLNVALMVDVVTITTRHHLKIYYTIGWGVPAVFVTAFVIVMMLENEESCWTGYSDMKEMWILLAPIAFELMVNGVFLLNILRILLRKVRNSNVRSESSQIKSAAKATAVLFPVLGLNNLILLYNPGGDYNKYFLLLNSFFSSTQGIFVAIVFCFTDKDVCAAVRRSIDRAKSRRMGNTNLLHNIIPSSVTTAIEMVTRRQNVQSDNVNIEQSV